MEEPSPRLGSTLPRESEKLRFDFKQHTLPVRVQRGQGEGRALARGGATARSSLQSNLLLWKLLCLAYAFSLEEPSPRLGSTLPRESEKLRLDFKQHTLPVRAQRGQGEGRALARGGATARSSLQSNLLLWKLLCLAYAFSLEEPSPRLGSTLPRESEKLRFDFKQHTLPVRVQRGQGEGRALARGGATARSSLQSNLLLWKLLCLAYAFSLEEPSPRLGSTLPRESEKLRFDFKQDTLPVRVQRGQGEGRALARGGATARSSLQSNLLLWKLLCLAYAFSLEEPSPRLGSTLPRESEKLRFDFKQHTLPVRVQRGQGEGRALARGGATARSSLQSNLLLWKLLCLAYAFSLEEPSPRLGSTLPRESEKLRLDFKQHTLSLVTYMAHVSHFAKFPRTKSSSTNHE